MSDREKIELIKKNMLMGKTMCPIIVSKSGVVIDGNHRLQAARELGISTIPVVVLDVDISQVDIKSLKFGWDFQD